MATKRKIEPPTIGGVPLHLAGHLDIVTLEQAFTEAQTNTPVPLPTGYVPTGSRMVVTQIQAVAERPNSLDVAFRVGFGADLTPTTTGVLLSHSGLAAGGNISRGDGAGIIGIGVDGEDLRITCDGSLRLLVSYFLITP